MNKLRYFYEKTGRARYISHLDMMDVLRRAFTRAGVPAWQTEGFNPHVYMTIALPSSVGQESICEIVDFNSETDFNPSDYVDKLNVALPEGVRILRGGDINILAKALAFAEYSLVFEYDNGLPEGAANKILELLSQDELWIIKKSKKGLKDTDIAKSIASVSVLPQEDGIEVIARLAAGSTGALNPDYLTAAVKKYLPECVPDGVNVRRIAVFTGDMRNFM